MRVAFFPRLEVDEPDPEGRGFEDSGSRNDEVGSIIIIDCDKITTSSQALRIVDIARSLRES